MPAVLPDALPVQPQLCSPRLGTFGRIVIALGQDVLNRVLIYRYALLTSMVSQAAEPVAAVAKVVEVASLQVTSELFVAPSNVSFGSAFQGCPMVRLQSSGGVLNLLIPAQHLLAIRAVLTCVLSTAAGGVGNGTSGTAPAGNHVPSTRKRHNQLLINGLRLDVLEQSNVY